MALDTKAIHKPFRKLGKLLKNFPESPSPEDVHDVRTQTRRVEAIVEAFQLDDRKAGGTLVKALKPIRKAAGNVRDMDVLIDFAASLDPNDDGDCRLQLMEYLASSRKKCAQKLSRKVSDNAKPTRKSLKQCSKFAEAGLDQASPRDARTKDEQKNRKKSVRSMASSFQIEEELRAWPKLTENNIHPFRLKVKEWRYILQLGEKSDSKLIDELGAVKDQIGLWHDWNELADISGEALDHGAKCSIAAQIRSRTKQELEKALEKATAFRARYLPAKEDARNRKNARAEIHPAVAKATSRLATVA